MKRIFIAGLFVTGISLVVTSLGAWLAPDLITNVPGGVIALFAAIFVAVSGLFGGKMTEWADTIFGKEKEEQSSTIDKVEQQVNVNGMSGGVITKEYHHHEAPVPLPETHDTIGFIPPAKAETYIHRGNIEDDVITYIRGGGKVLLEQAIQLYNQIGDRYSVPAQIGNFGWELLRLNEPVRALPYLSRAADLFEEMGLSEYAERHRGYATAIQTALEVDKLLAHANELYEQKKYEQAIVEFQRVLDIAPDARAWNGLASALESLRRYDDAIDAYTHAIDREPDSAYLYRNRANILLDRDRLDEAEHDIARAVELQPEHPYTHARQGYLALARGNFDDALPHFEFAVANDESRSWKFGLALCIFALGDMDKVQELLSGALQDAEKEEREDATKWLERTVRSKPELETDAKVLRDMLA